MMKYRLIIIPLIAVLAAASCDRFNSDGYQFDNSLYLDVSQYTSVQSTNFASNVESIEKEIVVTLAYPADYDVTATLSTDESLVSKYNEKYGTDLEMLPDGFTDFSSETVTIEAGKTISEAVVITLSGLAGDENGDGALEIDKSWLLPLRITASNMTVMTDAAEVYYVIRRSSSITTAARLTDNWINFPLMDEAGTVADAYNGLSAITYEALICIDQFDLTNDFGTCSISTVMGMEQYFLLRIGDTSFQRQQLQLDGTGSGTNFGKFPSSDASKILEVGQWYHVACTYSYDSRTVRIYVNGTVQSEGTEMGSATGGIYLAQRALGEDEAYQFFIAKSYNNYRPLQGMIAEARVWASERTEEEIWDNMYRIENPENYPELIGYWKFNEGEGNSIKDWSIYGNNGEAEYDIEWPDGIEIEEINKTEED